MRRESTTQQVTNRPVIELLEHRQLLNGVPTYDTSFNGSGTVLANWAGGKYATVVGVDALNNGQILAVGEGIPAGGSRQELFLARFNSNGSPDNTFNASQHVNYQFYAPFGAGSDVFAGGITPLASGKLVINGSNAGFATATNGFLLQLLANGTVDTSFGKNGVYTDPVQSINGLAAQGNNLLIGGVAGSNFAVSRVTPAGKLDSSFGSGGRDLFPPSALTTQVISKGSPSGYYLTVRADGSFIYSGIVSPGGNGSRSGFVANFNANGKFAPAFGSSSGEFLLNYGGDDSAYVTLNANGSLAVSDTRFQGQTVTLFTGTMSTTGIRSSLFQIGGFSFSGFVQEFDAKVAQSNGSQIETISVLSGDSSGAFTTGGQQAALFRTNSSQSGLDTSFGTGGKFSLTSTGTSLFPLASALTPDGKLLIGGVAKTSSGSFSVMLARFNISAGAGAVTGHVYKDVNINAKLDAGEALANVPVYLDLANSGKYQSGDPITKTDVNGFYSLANIAPGKYTVRVDTSLLPGLSYESPKSGSYSENVTAGTTVGGVDFALATAKPMPVISISAADSTASVGGFGAPVTTGDFVLHRSGVTNIPVALTLQLSGTAHFTSAQKDFSFGVFGAQSWSFNATTGQLSLTLAANSTGAEIVVTPLLTNLASSETVTLTLSNQSSYAIDTSHNHATVTIQPKAS